MMDLMNPADSHATDDVAAQSLSAATRTVGADNQPASPAEGTATAWPEIHAALTEWFARNARPLPWRADRNPWGVLVSEVMGQQTPMKRVVPRWEAWLTRWPSPAHLAGAEPADVLRAWDRLGYPRRAKNLHLAAQQIVERHGGAVPSGIDDLLALAGVGPYTASAVRAFAFRQRTPVLDTNTRRVLARLDGTATIGANITRVERARAEVALPAEPEESAVWNEALMELGALVCTPKPACEACPVAEMCAWRAAGYPDDPAPVARPQAWTGTDRQARGRIMALLRDVETASVDEALAVACVSDDETQPARALASLAADGLVTVDGGRVRLGS